MMKLKFAFPQKCLRVAVTQRNRRRRRDREALVLASLTICRKIEGERETRDRGYGAFFLSCQGSGVTVENSYGEMCTRKRYGASA